MPSKKSSEKIIEEKPQDGIDTKSDKPENTSVAETEKEIITEKVEATAKAGKRSAKSIKEAEEKEAKEARKAEAKDETAKPTVKPQPKTRSRLERRGKKYRAVVEKIDISKDYPLDEAVKLVESISTTSFDGSVELHVRLNVDPRQADQNIRSTLVLPHGTGREQRVAVFAETDMHAAAQKAGADIVGEDDFLKQLDKAVIDFDVLIATPSLMARLSKYAKLLGPRGLMPNPKSGTVTKEIARAVAEAKAGRVEYRVDSNGIIHLGVGKVSFEPAHLQANIEAVMSSIRSNKPTSVKGAFVTGAHLSVTMGPSLRISL